MFIFHLLSNFLWLLMKQKIQMAENLVNEYKTQPVGWKLILILCQILQDCDWNRKFKVEENLTWTQNTGSIIMALKSIIKKMTLNQKGGNLTWIQKQIHIKEMFDP